MQRRGSAGKAGTATRTAWASGAALAVSAVAPLQAQTIGEGGSEGTLATGTERTASEAREVTAEEALPREIVVLSGLGDVELSIGLSYARSARSENLRVRRSRSLSVPLNLSIGLGRELELSLGTGLFYGEREELLLDGATGDSERTLGDVSLGLSWQVSEDDVDTPAISLSIGSSVPSDEGDGPISLSLDAAFSRRLDPVLLFGRVGYGGALGSREIDGVRLRDGDAISYGFGLSFVVNSSIVLSGRFDASFELDASRDGETVEGSGSEPMYLAWSVGYAGGGRDRWGVSLTQGLNEDAGEVQVGVSFVRDLRASGR